MVLLAVHLGDEYIFLVGAPGDIGEVHLALVHRGVADRVEINQFTGSRLIDAHGNPVALHAGHGILDGHGLGLTGFGIHQRIVHHHALVHAIEGQTAGLGRPEETAVDAELVAVDTLAEDHIVAVATLNEIAVDIEASLFFLHTLLQLGIAILGLAPVLLGFGELEFLLAVEGVETLVLATLVIGDGLAVGGEDETHHLTLGVEVAVHQLVPLQEFLLRHHRSSTHQGRQSQYYLFHISVYLITLLIFICSPARCAREILRIL